MPSRPRVLIVAPIAVSDPARTTFYSTDDSIEYYRLGFPSNRGRLHQVVSLFLTGIELRRTVKTRSIDLIICDGARVGLTVALLVRLFGIGRSVIIWSFNILRPYKKLRARMAKVALGGVDLILVYSRHEQRLYAQHFSLNPHKVQFKFLSGPYLEDPRYVALVQHAEKKGYVVCPGYSGRDFNLLSEVARLAADVRFIVLAYPWAVQSVQFPPNVEVRYGIPEVEYCRYIAEARLCFVPVANKTTANGHIAIIQAMSLKTLLLTNATPGTRDYLSGDDNCLLLDQNDAEAVSRQLVQAFNDVGRFQSIVDRAYAQAAIRFSVKADIDVLHEFLSIPKAACVPHTGVSQCQVRTTH